MISDFKEELKTQNIEYEDDWRIAGYNSPFTLPFCRTNEIWIRVK